MTSRPHVVALTGAIRTEIPRCCADCVFWQTLAGGTDTRRKDVWIRGFEETHGAWGRAMFAGDTFLGLLQYGPSSAFPRARALPGGPPDPNGVLVACSFLTEGDPTHTLERLILDALADAKGRSFEAVDAFAVGPHGSVPTDEQLVGHHTLFPRSLLAGLGFQETRVRGPIALMRLSLRGLQEASAPERGEEPVPGVVAAPS